MKLVTSRKTSLPTLLLTNESPALHVDTKINIVLSPSFYWFKAEQLPVKRASEAKNLAPSIFDGTMSEGEYSYHAIKKEESFWLFAYDNLLIAQSLADVGIKANNIANIYFAQTECVNTTESLKVSDTLALVSQNDAVSLIPLQYTQGNIEIEEYFKTHTFSKEKISVNFFQNNFIESKYLYRLSVLAFITIITYGSSYIMLNNTLSEQEQAIETLKEKYALPSTSFELKGLKNALEKKKKRQLSLREHIKTLLSLKLQKGEYIQKIIIKEKNAHIEIVLTNKKHAKALKNHLQKSMHITKAKMVDSLFLLGVKYE